MSEPDESMGMAVIEYNDGRTFWRLHISTNDAHNPGMLIDRRLADEPDWSPIGYIDLPNAAVRELVISALRGRDASGQR